MSCCFVTGWFELNSLQLPKHHDLAQQRTEKESKETVWTEDADGTKGVAVEGQEIRTKEREREISLFPHLPVNQLFQWPGIELLFDRKGASTCSQPTRCC